MSYRSLKRVLGETSLERKCLFLFGTCLLILITSGFWWYSSQTDDLVLDATRRFADGLKGTILIKRHFEVLTTSHDFETNEILYRELAGRGDRLRLPISCDPTCLMTSRRSTRPKRPCSRDSSIHPPTTRAGTRFGDRR